VKMTMMMMMMMTMILMMMMMMMMMLKMMKMMMMMMMRGRTRAWAVRGAGPVGPRPDARGPQGCLESQPRQRLAARAS